MNKPFANFEIIGFDEAIRADIPAGRSRPFVRERGTDRCFLLDWGDTPDVAADMQTWEQIQDYAAEGRLTLLDLPVPAFDRAVALIVSDELLAAAKVALPLRTSIAGQSYVLDWQTLAGVATKINVAIVAEAVSIVLLNEWTCALKTQIRAQLQQYFAHCDLTARARAEHFAEMALFTAFDSNLRAEILLYFGVALGEHSPERLDNVFEALSTRAPSWKWERFIEEVKHLADALKPPTRKACPKCDTQLEDRSDAAMTASRQPDDLEKVRKAFLVACRVIAELDEPAQVERAELFANQMRQKYAVPAELTAELIEKMKMRIETQRTTDPRCEFDDDAIRLLVTDPLFYLPQVIAERSKIVLDLTRFWHLAENWNIHSESPLGNPSKHLLETVGRILKKSRATACEYAPN